MKKSEKKLLELNAALDKSGREMLLAFAEFLANRIKQSFVLMEPVDIPRPAEESVVAAIKRLSATYPMLDKGKLLNETSALVAQHVMKGRDASEVIDEIEQIFASAYQQYQKVHGMESGT